MERVKGIEPLRTSQRHTSGCHQGTEGRTELRMTPNLREWTPLSGSLAPAIQFPSRAERLSFRGGVQRGFKEFDQQSNDGLERRGFRLWPGLSPERRPAASLRGVSRKGWRQTRGQSDGKRRAAALEGPGDGFREEGALKGELLREIVEVEIIFEAGVQHSQFDDGFQLFGDNGFAGIGPQLGRGHGQQDGECDFFGRNGKRVAKANIHLQDESGLSQVRPQFDPDAGVFILSANVLTRDGARIELNAVGATSMQQSSWKISVSRPSDGVPNPRRSRSRVTR